MPPKPFVSNACLCEKVLIEKDGVITLVRVVDRFTVAIPPNVPEEFKPHISMQLIIALKCPGYDGDTEITLEMHGPTKAEPAQTLPLKFPGGHTSGVNLVTTIVLGIQNYGDCRFDVRWQGELLTSVPFMLIQGQAPPDTSVSPKGS